MDIQKTVFEIVAEQLGIPDHEISLSTNIYDCGGDSLDGIEIVMALEDDLDITIFDGDVEDFTTVGEMVDFLKKVVPQ